MLTLDKTQLKQLLVSYNTTIKITTNFNTHYSVVNSNYSALETIRRMIKMFSSLEEWKIISIEQLDANGDTIVFKTERNNNPILSLLL